MPATPPLLQSVDIEELDSALGGERSTTITTPIGTYKSTQNDYSECLSAGVKGKWPPKSIRDTCGLPKGSRDAGGTKTKSKTQ